MSSVFAVATLLSISADVPLRSSHAIAGGVSQIFDSMVKDQIGGISELAGPARSSTLTVTVMTSSFPKSSPGFTVTA